MTFYYESGNGDTIVFDGNSPFFADPDTLRNYGWAYVYANNAVTRFTNDKREVKLDISIEADSEAEGAALLERIIRAFEHDVRARTAGIINLDGYEARAYAIAGEMSTSSTFGLYQIELAVTLLFEKPEWVKEKAYLFARNGEGSGEQLNFPLDFSFDLSSNTNNGFDASTDFESNIRLTIFGPATNPEIIIGGNRYTVETEIVNGGRLIIDGRDRSKINLYDQYGNVSNVFHNRNRGKQGSGDYIFEKVKSGFNSVTWDNSFTFELVVYDERSFPPCSI